MDDGPDYDSETTEMDGDHGTPPGEALPGRRANRHSEPQRGRTAVRVLVATGVLLAFAALIAYGFRWVSANERVRSARESVDSAARLMDVAEENLIVVDEAVQTDISVDVATQTADAAELAGPVGEQLADAIDMIEGALPDLPADDLPLAQALLESAQARADMMTEAPTILDANRKAAAAAVFADAALEALKAAEGHSARATVEFNKHTKEGVRASGEASVKAEQQLAVARSQLTSATAVFPDVDYGAFTEYIDAKVALIGVSKEIDQLWLADKIEESNKRLEAYNKRDAEVVAMAKALPASVRDPIADAYAAATKEAVERYFTARERARAAGEAVEELREAAVSRTS